MVNYAAHIIGQHAEAKACRYLMQHGLQFIAANFRCKLGEIDLIMRDEQQIVFIEVRARRSQTYGSSAETITIAKQAKLLKTALYYLQTQNLLENTASRFDVLTFDGQTQQIQWIKNAFSADEF